MPEGGGDPGVSNDWCITRNDVTRVNPSLAIVFARLPFQYGAGNCKKGYFLGPFNIAMQTQGEFLINYKWRHVQIQQSAQYVFNKKNIR